MTAPTQAAVPRLIEQFEHGLDAPICLTWELTYACNLACVHCLSSSGKRDPRELSTRQCMDIIDELERMQVFYVNIGGGEPTVRPDFWELVDYATAHHVGVKFSTNGVRITPEVAARLAASDYVDVQISLDGATAEVNDAVRGPGSFDMAVRALENLADAGFKDAKISVVVTRHNVDQLDEFAALASRYGATLRITRLRPSGRGADVWEELHPTADQQVQLYDWLVAKGERVLTGDSFFHLAPLGQSGALAGLNMCGAGRVVCLIDPSATCTPARSPSMTASWPETCCRTAALTTCGRTPRCSASCANRSRRAPAAVAGITTAAGAAAWRPSSSPACRWTGRTPNASRATARRRWRTTARRRAPGPTTPAASASANRCRSRCRCGHRRSRPRRRRRACVMKARCDNGREMV
ncbi:radical SAM domain-containing protein [Mycobacterium intracellulare MOTT-02]|nr:radical SAM domain-containing protein [Mycobacterium intracellulare MOTT-02]